MIKVRAELYFDDLIEKFGLGLGGRVQTAVDSAVIKYSIPFCPWDSGKLAHSPYKLSPPGGGKVIYEGPYARYLWHGKVMGPNFPIYHNGELVGFRSPKGSKKYVTDRLLTYQKKQPSSGPRWTDRMKAVHIKDIVREGQEAV